MERTFNLQERAVYEVPERSDEHSSGVSWGAVIGGAFVAAAISLIMLALGAGFGLSAVSPWSGVGPTAEAIGTVGIAWLIVMQVVAFSMGGYLTGRLRTKWVAIHTDEVHFRDTANGFLVWAVGLVVTVTFLVSAAASMAGTARPDDEALAPKPAADVNDYLIDRLFRADNPSSQPTDETAQVEAGRILSNSLLRQDATANDQAYLAKLVAARTGLTQAEAQNRVAQAITDAREAANVARRNTARFLLWIFVALLIGAFCSSFAATIGGRQRDRVKSV